MAVSERMAVSRDRDLMARVAAADHAAMRALFARHNVRVFRFLVRRVKNDAIAEELTGDVFLAVWRQAGRYQGRSTVSTWMLAIAHHKAMDVLRKRSEVGLDEKTAAEIADTSDNPESLAHKRRKGAIIRAAMSALSAEHSEVIDLVYYHEKSIREVAEIVGIPEGTVKTRMHHARKQLGELLKDAGIDRGWP